MLTQDELKELLHYDPVTGVFRWRISPSYRVKPWAVAGCLMDHQYIGITIRRKLHFAHRLAWLYMTGKWPECEVDHKDRVRSNNAWINLREATHKQNSENLTLAKNNTSGFRGVSWHKKSKKWKALVVHNNTFISAGYFDSAEEAGKAAAAKRAELFTHDTGQSESSTNCKAVSPQ